MSSIILQNENSKFNNSEYQKNSILKTQRNYLSKRIENNNNLRSKLLNKLYLKDINNIKLKALKDFEINNKEKEFNKKYFELKSQENGNYLKPKSFFPLLKNDYIKKEKILPKPVSLINIKEMNKIKDINFNDYLYLEYKKIIM